MIAWRHMVHSSDDLEFLVILSRTSFTTSKMTLSSLPVPGNDYDLQELCRVTFRVHAGVTLQHGPAHDDHVYHEKKASVPLVTQLYRAGIM